MACECRLDCPECAETEAWAERRSLALRAVALWNRWRPDRPVPRWVRLALPFSHPLAVNPKGKR